jgi:serine/threonine protein kinase/Tfp pilus assembly major pilin PilA
MGWMFRFATKFSSSLHAWDVSGVNDMSLMFFCASEFTSDLNAWDVSGVSTMRWMFRITPKFSSSLDAWDVSGVKDMGLMFFSALEFTSDLNAWDVSGVRSMYQMFYSASEFTSDLNAWTVSEVTSMHQMFSFASVFTSDLNAWDVSRVRSMYRMFYSTSEFTSDLNAWNVSGVTSMHRMFFGASKFRSDLNAWNVSGVRSNDTDEMFSNASAFTCDMIPLWFTGEPCTTITTTTVTTVTTTTTNTTALKRLPCSSSADEACANVSKKISIGTAIGVTVGSLVVLGAIVALAVYRTRRAGSGGERAFADNPHWAVDPRRKTQNTLKVVSSSAAKLAVQIADVVRERAEARFVIEYRQLVAEDSMEAFQSAFRELEVSRDEVSVGAELGRGQSGVVFAGMWNSTAVAIKTREIIDESDIVGATAAIADEAMLLEALLLNGLRHPAIVSLLAVVAKVAPIFICIELMEGGDLREFLRSCRPKNASSQSASPSRMPRGTSQQRRAEITPRVMTLMAAKLGSAMAFLEQRHIIHRDVAARNVLVGAAAIDVKLADLGAARSVHRISEISSGGVYTATSDHAPARWMSLEALREAKFSHKSDVFAFGVLLWEILSMGKTPWGAFGVQDFTSALVRGERMPRPALLESRADGADANRDGSSIAAHDLFQKIYAVAVRCWTENPERRPHFHQLEAEFAIHETVLIAETRQRGRTISEAANRQLQANDVDDDGYLRPTSPGDNSDGESVGVKLLDGDGYVADESFSRRPTLDIDGYVADESFCRRPTLDVDGYVADERFSRRPTHAVDGYIADESFSKRAAPVVDGYIANELETRRPTLRLDAAGKVEVALQRVAAVASATASLLVDPQIAAAHGVKPRSGIAPRRDRKPSVYDGFGNGDGSGNVSQNNLPLPQTQAAVATAFQPPATRSRSETTRRVDVEPSLNLGFDQSVARIPLPDETRL